jgi:hypothetical protein
VLSLQQPCLPLQAKLKIIRGARFTAVGWAEAVQIAASQHFNSAWTPRAGSAASVNRIRNTSHHPDHTHLLGTKGAICIKRQHRYGLQISFGRLAIFAAIRYASSLLSNLAVGDARKSYSPTSP